MGKSINVIIAKKFLIGKVEMGMEMNRGFVKSVKKYFV
jgi:hypothetical protein